MEVKKDGWEGLKEKVKRIVKGTGMVAKIEGRIEKRSAKGKVRKCGEDRSDEGEKKSDG